MTTKNPDDQTQYQTDLVFRDIDTGHTHLVEIKTIAPTSLTERRASHDKYTPGAAANRREQNAKKEYKSRFHIDSDNVTMHFIAVETSGNIGRGTIDLARFIANNQDPADEFDVIAESNTPIPFQRTLRRIYKRINVSVLSFRSGSALNDFSIDSHLTMPHLFL